MLRYLRTLIRHTGFDVIRYTPNTSRILRLVTVLQAQKINLVLDVGANTGQYALDLFSAGYSGRIVSFEPMRAAYEQLLRQQTSRVSRWQAQQCALGAAADTLQINVAANSVSSSLKPMLAAHAEAAPQSSYTGTETVTVRTLDEVAPMLLNPADHVLLKIDTQGYEAEVLAGAARTLPCIHALQLEMSLLPLYEGQMLFDELHTKVLAQGFMLWGLDAGFTHPATGRMLQLDGLYVRT